MELTKPGKIDQEERRKKNTYLRNKKGERKHHYSFYNLLQLNQEEIDTI